MVKRHVIVLLVVAAAAALTAPAASPGESVRWFVTPDAVECELGLNRTGLHPPTYAFCLAYRPGRPYRTALAPDNTQRLATGRSIALGPFRCTSLRVGVRCLVTELGRGFKLNAHGVTRI